MTDTLKKGWTRVAFGDVVERVKESRIPTSDESRTYIGLEHLDINSYAVTRWGSEVDLVVTKTIIKKGDVLFARRNTHLQRCAVAPFDTCFSPDGYAFRTKSPLLLQEYLLHVVASNNFMGYAIEHSAGTHSKRVKWEDIARFSFTIPPISNQQRMAEPISLVQNAADKITSLNIHMNRLHRSYLNRQIKSSLGDERFRIENINKYSEKTRPLSSLCSHIVDCLHRTPVYEENGIIAIRTTDVGNGYLKLNQAYLVSEEEYKIQTSRLIPKEGDILFSREAPMGNAALVPSDIKLCISQRMMHLRTNPDISPKYVVEMLDSQFVRDQINRVAVGSTVLHINVADVKKILIPTFDHESERIIGDHAFRIRSTMLNNIHRVNATVSFGRKLINKIHGEHI